MNDLHYDLCVIGGGINGAGIARDAAGRGLSVLLVEAEDLAGATSSASTKLIHGGLRYLENYEFSMVRKALKEREVIYKNAPHLVRPIQCVLPCDDQSRSQWILRLGLWIYDRLGGTSSLPKSHVFDLSDCALELSKPLSQRYANGMAYFDCWGDDTRLVIANALDAASRGAEVATYTKCVSLDVVDSRWRVGLMSSKKTVRESVEREYVSASMVVNATGPWVRQFLDFVDVGGHDPDLPDVRLVKGSHLLLPKQYDGDHAYVLQQTDGRIVFVAPYENDFTLIGTTEEGVEGDPRDVRISDAEKDYLISAYNVAFSSRISDKDIIFALSGVRPLIDDGRDNMSKVTRDYKIYHHSRYDPPFLSVYGGKLTTYRAVAEDVVNRLMTVSGHVAQGWTASEALAGGDFGGKSFDEYFYAQKAVYPWLPDSLLHRYLRSYGTRMDYFLYGKEALDDMGVCYGDGIYEAEIKYLVDCEWVCDVEDILWRRGKLGLHIGDQTVDEIGRAIAKFHGNSFEDF